MRTIQVSVTEEQIDLILSFIQPSETPQEKELAEHLCKSWNDQFASI